MREYTISKLYGQVAEDRKVMERLLQSEGLQIDAHLEYSCGIFDESGNLIATGSCFKNTLRCIAIDSYHQGEGLMNQIISHLMEYMYSRGETHIFVYTKVSAAKFFKDLGFYEIATVGHDLVFLESKRQGFADYLSQLVVEAKTQCEYNSKNLVATSVAAIVMNANPFTSGHQQLVELVAQAHEIVHLFIVSEDNSIVPFSVRWQLVQAGTSHLDNIIYHKTGSYIISNATFPAYFLKDSKVAGAVQMRLEAALFAKIAKALHITHRYVGTEPFSEMTNDYNQILKTQLGASLIVREIPRFIDATGRVISASKVRRLLKEGNLCVISSMVPKSTYDFLCSEEGKVIIERCQETAIVEHH